jgi:hypothetical protein
MEGIVSTIAGSKEIGDKDGYGISAKFHNLSGIVVDEHSSCLFVVDSGNCAIRKITYDGMVLILGC